MTRKYPRDGQRLTSGELYRRAAAVEILAQHLSRTRNFPQDGEGLANLADALLWASDSYDVNELAVLRRCAELSQHCPADADLLNVAGDLADERAKARDQKQLEGQEQVWRKQYGPPLGFAPDEQPDWYPKTKRVLEGRRVLWSKLRDRFHSVIHRKDWPDWYTLACAAQEFALEAREMGDDSFASICEEYARAWAKATGRELPKGSA